MFRTYIPAGRAALSFVFLAWILASGKNAQGQAQGQEVATLTDVAGTVMHLRTFGVSLTSSNDFRFDAPGPYYRWGTIYGEYNSGSLPIRQTSGAVLFVEADSIKEYQCDGKLATITLVTGDRLLGSPLPGASIIGETTLGSISIALPKVKGVVINTENVKRLFDAKEADFAKDYRTLVESGWLAKYKRRGDVTLSSGDTLALGALALVTESPDTGCDASYIPCRPWGGTNWSMAEKIYVRYGESDAEVAFSNMSEIALTTSTKRGVGPTSLSITLQNGDKVAATVNSSPSGKAVAFIGTTSFGYAHIPLVNVKAVKFADQ